MQKIKVAVDFDGTLIEPFVFPSVRYKLKPYAKEVLRRLSEKGIEFELYTARYGWWRIPAILFCKKEKLPIKTKLFNKKPRANIYIDNRNIFCKKIDWLEIEKEILRKLESECIM